MPLYTVVYVSSSCIICNSLAPLQYIFMTEMDSSTEITVHNELARLLVSECDHRVADLLLKVCGINKSFVCEVVHDQCCVVGT